MERRWVSPLLLLSTVAATSSSSGPARVFTLKSTTTEEVPTFYHLTEYTGLVCNGTAFTDNEALGCNGWHGLSELDCKKKCAAGEQLESCPNKLCFAISYHQGGGGWCHIYDHANCLGMVSRPYVTSFKKEHGNQGGMPAINTSNIDLRAVAMAAGAALVAAAEMSARHRARIAGNFSTTSRPLQPVTAGAHDYSHLSATTPRVVAVGHDSTHFTTTLGQATTHTSQPLPHIAAIDHSSLTTKAPLARTSSSTPLAVAGGHNLAHLITTLTTTPAIGHRQREGHDPVQLITNKPAVVISNPVPSSAAGASSPSTPASFLHAAIGSTSQRPGSTSSTGSFGAPHALIAVPGLLVLGVCCCLVGKAKRSRRDSGDAGAADGLGDVPRNYPRDLE